MLSKTCNHLPPNRQNKILCVCLESFVAKGYDAASTNHMVSRLGIAKGTLFKYVGSKENLFLHLVEQVLTELAEIQNDPNIYRSTDLFIRVEELFVALLAYADKEPLRYSFSLRATVDTSSSIYPRVEQLRRDIAKDHLSAIFEGVDWERYCHPREEVIEIFAWLLAGTRATSIAALGRDFSMEDYIGQVLAHLALLNKLLHSGVYRHKEERP